MNNNIELLLSEAGSIIKKYEAIAFETGANFNIFEIADISTKEVRMCRVLAELLSPQGQHGQGNAYLELFMRDCLGSNEKIEKAQVHIEHSTDKGRRIDIVLQVNDNFIPVEVKIYAKDQWRQCQDYYEYAQSKFGRADELIFLTLDGRKPSDESIGNMDGEKIVLLSFEKHITAWLENCLALSETIRKAPVREIIIQLISTIKKLTNQLEDKPKMEMIALLSSSSQNIKNAEAIANSLNACKSDMIFKLLKAIENGINRKKLSIMDYEADGGQEVKTYYDKSKPTYPAINYRFKSIKSDVELWFRIELGWNLYAGLCVVTDNDNKGWTLTPEECKKYNIEQNDSDWWSKLWGYLPCESEALDFKNCDDNFYNLFDEHYFNEFVEKCIKQINMMWNEYENEIM
jgi:hypothetical protein